MTAHKQLWLLVGGNGAGKTTFYQTRLQPMGLPFINADNIAAGLYPEQPEAHSYEAASLAEDLRLQLLSEGRSFCFETVFSHPSKIDFVARAKALGYTIVLVVIHLSEVSLNKARISQRIAQGGHAVPDDKVEQRIPRLLHNLATVMPLCDNVYLLDNSSADEPFRLVSVITGGQRVDQTSPLPKWAKILLNPGDLR